MLRGLPWTEREVQLVVDDYMAMLEKELRGIPYKKTEHRRALKPLLNDRNDSAIEMKHQNITAILLEIKFPPIRGYKPLGRYQRLLAEMVIDRVEDDAVLQALALDYVEKAGERGPINDILHIRTDPPSLLPSLQSALANHAIARRARKIDYLAREAQNRQLGLDGEKLVLTYERARLSSLGLDVLADRIEHTSVVLGDGLGYDVLSYSADGRERYIEVKTTKLGPQTPFYVTTPELNFSADNAAAYSLYRVYEFTSAPQLFTLDGSVEETCRIRPAQYIATPRA